MAHRNLTQSEHQSKDRTVARGAEGLKIEEEDHSYRNPQRAKASNKKKASLSNIQGVMDIDEKMGGAFYLPVTLDNVDKVWNGLVQAMGDMEQLDMSVQKESKEAYGLKYFKDTFVLARTRLCRIEGELFIELRRLEGDGFTFSDQYKQALQKSLQEFVEQQADDEDDEVFVDEMDNDKSLMYLDLNYAEDILKYWIESLRPSENLKYDPAKLYDTLSSIGWNCTDGKNLEVLKPHASDIVRPILGVLLNSEHLPTIYFAALTLSKFAEGKAIPEEVINWETVNTICTCILTWSCTKPPCEHEITRSRELIRLLGNTLKTVGPQIDAEKTKSVGKTLKKLFGQKLEFEAKFWDVDGVKAALRYD